LDELPETRGGNQLLAILTGKQSYFLPKKTVELRYESCRNKKETATNNI
jgi:hypothetical protein